MQDPEDACDEFLRRVMGAAVVVDDGGAWVEVKVVVAALKPYAADYREAWGRATVAMAEVADYGGL